MKILKTSLIVSVLLLSMFSIACEHCDDEDYRRAEAEENASQIHNDTTSISNQ